MELAWYNIILFLHLAWSDFCHRKGLTSSCRFTSLSICLSVCVSDPLCLAQPNNILLQLMKVLSHYACSLLRFIEGKLIWYINTILLIPYFTLYKGEFIRNSDKTLPQQMEWCRMVVQYLMDVPPLS